MGRARTTKYTKQEISDASKKWMKSLNMINQKPLKFTPQVANSLARNSTISKSAMRRRNRKERANIAGKTMDSLAAGLAEVEQKLEAEPLPKHTGLIDPNSSTRNNKKVFDNEVNAYKKTVGLSLAEIRAKLKGQ